MNPYASLSTPDLFERREAMEIEMRAISARLSAPDAPGLRGRLVDAEGFPIAGCDLYAVRADRGRYDGARDDARRPRDGEDDGFDSIDFSAPPPTND
jgi:26S proteasome non-ATPase regulatory subunit 9|tara:strand:- start:10658 stop:10948 length:291 start_codon:yes stop_codon:yes gene_type:complete